MSSVLSSAVRRSSPRATFAWLAGTLALLAILPAYLPTYHVSVLTQILIFGVFAMSIDILAGYAGRTSLGHGAIFGTATYVVLYFVSTSGMPLYFAIPLAVLAATLVAAVFAVLAIRTTGVYFLLLTLALGMIVWGICLRWSVVTGGENGIRGDVRPAVIGDSRSFYYVTLICCTALTYAMVRFINSPFGLTLSGIRDSAGRMRSLGYDVSMHLFIGFVMSGFFAGLAGALYAMFNNFVSPSTVALTQSVTGLLMAIVGGVGTLFGALIGSFVMITLENFVSYYTQRWPTVLGLVFIFTMIFAPAGVLGTIRALRARRGN
jgi:branched-chain amino acid transport system permease protein